MCIERQITRLQIESKITQLFYEELRKHGMHINQLFVAH